MSVLPSEITCRFYLNKAANIHCALYDVNGRCLSEQTIAASMGYNDAQIAVSGLSQAYYLLSLQADGKRQTALIRP